MLINIGNTESILKKNAKYAQLQAEFDVLRQE